EVKRIANEIRYRIKERRLHVIVAEDNRILLEFEAVDLGSNLGFHPEFKVRHHVGKPFLELEVHGIGSSFSSKCCDHNPVPTSWFLLCSAMLVCAEQVAFS